MPLAHSRSFLEINKDILEEALEKIMSGFVNGKTEHDIACIAKTKCCATVFCKPSFVDAETEEGLLVLRDALDSEVDGPTSFDVQEIAFKKFLDWKEAKDYLGV